MKISNIITGILIFVLILSFMWLFYIVPKQIDFINSCEIKCGNLGNRSYDTEFRSIPLNNLNAKCYCVERELILSVKQYAFKEAGK